MYFMRRILFISLCLSGFMLSAQSPEAVIRSIYDEALSSREAYENLRYLCKTTKGRITGSQEAALAVEFTRRVMEGLMLDTVYLQEMMVPRWVRGRESASVQSASIGRRALSVCSLGLSGSSGEEGLTGSVIEVRSLDELSSMERERVEGRIVFFNRPMDPTMIQTFAAYGQAVDQRVQGPALAAGMGAVAALVRSATTAMDEVPHTGVTVFGEGQARIPAMAVSTLSADLLSEWLRQDPGLTIHLVNTCRMDDDVTSYNVVGELRGSVFPEQIITVGGHLDAWDTGEGAHDDGAGCIQSIEVLRLFRALDIKPRRTIRAVMFMDEEIAHRGAACYFEQAKVKHEIHYAALEADRGALSPRSFGFSATPQREDSLMALSAYFKPYGLSTFTRGGGGADIGPLAAFGTVLITFVPDAQRYFDYHHSANDSFEQVHPRELQLGSAAIASLIYLIDRLDL